jgi:cytochrome c oxidase subunit II
MRRCAYHPCSPIVHRHEGVPLITRNPRGMWIEPIGSETMSPTSIFTPASTPAAEIMQLAMLCIAVAAAIFACVGALLAYAVLRFRRRPGDDGTEPPQVYGSHQVEIAWTVTPILIVVVLFLASTRVIRRVQDADPPDRSMQVVAVGHQFWWEYRYPKLGIVTANELHVPVSDPHRPTPTFITLLSADTDHSFWIPRLAGKTDLIPNRVNNTWIDPHETGLFLGQCAQYCGTQHAKMLLRVYVDSKENFDAWARQQQQPARNQPDVADGRRVFERTSCVNCHAVSGTDAAGQFGPDLTHLMSRDTIASGIVPNNVVNLRAWIQDPEALKPGSRMPAMKLSDQDLDSLTAYLATLR